MKREDWIAIFVFSIVWATLVGFSIPLISNKEASLQTMFLCGLGWFVYFWGFVALGVGIVVNREVYYNHKRRRLQ
ncbi:MAG: hypothetical protein V1851_01040 [Patescibacteria group bacterium]